MCCVAVRVVVSLAVVSLPVGLQVRKKDMIAHCSCGMVFGSLVDFFLGGWGGWGVGGGGGWGGGGRGVAFGVGTTRASAKHVVCSNYQ